MLERYKRTFYGTQLMIAAVTAVIFFQLRIWQTTAVFFAVMQIGAVVGAMWASRLKRKLEQHQQLLQR